MSLMIDRLDFKRWDGHQDIAAGWHAHELPADDLLGEHTPAFEITNVSDLAYRMKPFGGTPQNITIDPDKFPNVAPAFRSYWCEWRCPPELDRSYTIGRFGIWTVITGDTDDDRWVLVCAVFCNDRKPRPIGYFNLEIAKYGGRVVDPGRLTIFPDEADRLLGPWEPSKREPTDTDAFADQVAETVRDLSPEDRDRYIASEVERLDADALELRRKAADLRTEMADKVGEMIRIGVLPPFLLAHSLLGCKNVDTEDHRPDAKLVKATMKRHGHGLTTFKTLAIRTMGGSKETGERTALGNGQTALHLVRGHFKTFTQERPLFGNIVGTYWWSPNVRGKAEEGVIVKDYKVTA